jgi:hypothetical protein
MTETPGRYDPQAEGEHLNQECLELLNRIKTNA